MANEMTTTRTSGTYAFGGRVLRGLLTAVAGGSIVLGGQGIFFDVSQQTAPTATVVPEVNITYGTGNLITYTRQNLTAGTGGLVGDNLAAITNPYSATGQVIAAYLDCTKANNNISTDLGIVSALSSSGIQLWNNKRILTGATIGWTGSGYTTAQNTDAGGIVKSGQLVKLSSLSSFTSGSLCSLTVEWRELWRP